MLPCSNALLTDMNTRWGDGEIVTINRERLRRKPQGLTRDQVLAATVDSRLKESLHGIPAVKHETV